VFAQLLAVLELRFAQGVEHLDMSVQLEAELGDVPVHTAHDSACLLALGGDDHHLLFEHKTLASRSVACSGTHLS
jgi:hypothetical protein